MNFSKLLIIIISFFAFNLLNAKEVNLKQAKTVADNFYTSNNEKSKIVWDGIELYKTADKTDFYIFNSKINNAFVIVSGEDKAKPIIAYSFDNTFDKDRISPALQYFIDGYKEDINELRMLKEPQNSEIAKLWSDYLNNTINNNNKASVLPLIQTEWGQGCFFNQDCPSDNAGPCNRALTGCVATAMAQIINFHEFPSSGYGSNSYNHPTYGNLSVDFTSVNYDYSNMPNDLNYYSTNAEKAAVAELMYHCGVSVDMNYGPDGSGSSDVLARNALVENFNYKVSTNIEMASDYSTIDWINKVKDNLNNGLPILYGAVDNSIGFGHAFIVDGYQGTANFHLNWGWEGSNDGYYNLASLNPSTYNFDAGHEAIFNIEPAEGCSSGLTTLTSNTGTIGDGSGYEDYQSNLSCEWLISPKSGNVVSLFFENLDTESGVDEIKVYDGTNSNGSLLLTTSGNSLPGVVTATSGNMYITFTTNSSNNREGWTARWEDNYPNFCNSGQVVNQPYKHLSDGSGPSNYLNNSNCSWLIMPSGANFIGVKFHYMDIHSSDHLKIYNGPSNNFPLLGDYNGSTLPNSIESTNSKIFIEFITNSSNVAGGWELSYYKNSHVSVKESDIVEFKTYPNPATDKFTINIKGGVNDEIEIVFYNNMGQKIRIEKLKKETYYFKRELDVSNLESGIYYIQINYGESSVNKKLIVN